MPSLSVSSTLLSHIKVRKIADEFGCQAVAALFGLWFWCRQEKKTSVSKMELLTCRWESGTMNINLKDPSDLSKELYIERLLEYGLIRSNSGRYDVLNPLVDNSVAIEDPSVLKVVNAYIKEHPDYEDCLSEQDYKLISSRLSEGVSVEDLIKACEGIKGNRYYADNNLYEPRHVFKNKAKIREHINRSPSNKKKSRPATTGVGHHSGSKEFSNGRADL